MKTIKMSLPKKWIKDYGKYDVCNNIKSVELIMQYEEPEKKKDEKYIKRQLEFFSQRVMNGFSNRDVWGLYNYLAKVISDSCKTLRDNKCGFPCGMTYDKDGNTICSNEEGSKKWQNILTEISYAFGILANDHIDVIDYDSLNDKKHADELAKEAENKKKDGIEFRWATREEYARIRNGMQLFIEYFQNLWD